MKRIVTAVVLGLGGCDTSAPPKPPVIDGVVQDADGKVLLTSGQTLWTINQTESGAVSIVPVAEVETFVTEGDASWMREPKWEWSEDGAATVIPLKSGRIIVVRAESAVVVVADAHGAPVAKRVQVDSP